MSLSLANEPPLAHGYRRTWTRCAKCGDVAHHDTRRMALWQPAQLFALPCEHKPKHAEVIIQHRTEH
jgi:hypothetical protein